MDRKTWEGKCRFYTRKGFLHGSCTLRLPDGRLVEVSTQPGEGVDLNRLAIAIAKRQGISTIGWSLNPVDWAKSAKSAAEDAWGGVKKATRKVAQSGVAQNLFSKAKGIVQSKEFQTAMQFVPGGQYVALGTQAADLISRAAGGDKQATAQIAQVAQLASQGDQAASQAYNILQEVYSLGKQKQAWPMPTYAPPAYAPQSHTPPRMPYYPPPYPQYHQYPPPMPPMYGGGYGYGYPPMSYMRMAGWGFNSPFRSVAVDTVSNRLRYIYSLGLKN